jgi:serine/threonine protein kinase
MVGTAGYIAPELWGFIERGSAFSRDIWALGEILFEILTKKPAFTMESLATYKTQQQFPITKLRGVGVNQQGIDFILSLMCPYPNDRTTASSALLTVWIQSVIPASKSTTPFEDKPRVPGPSTTLTESFASWNTRSSTEAPQTVIHSMPGSITTPYLVNGTQGKTSTAQQIGASSSPLRTTRPQPMDGQIGTLTLSLCLFEGLQERALSLVHQHQNEKAESLFRRALQGREKELGLNHRDTLDSVQGLGVCLKNQNRYREAEAIFR